MSNSTRALLVGLSLAGSGAASPIAAQAGVGIDINIAPPAPRVEPDRWDASGPRWHRVPGHWER